jgi:hypothetical protein
LCKTSVGADKCSPGVQMRMGGSRFAALRSSSSTAGPSVRQAQTRDSWVRYSGHLARCALNSIRIHILYPLLPLKLPLSRFFPPILTPSCSTHALFNLNKFQMTRSQTAWQPLPPMPLPSLLELSAISCCLVRHPSRICGFQRLRHLKHLLCMSSPSQAKRG